MPPRSLLLCGHDSQQPRLFTSHLNLDVGMLGHRFGMLPTSAGIHAVKTSRRMFVMWPFRWEFLNEWMPRVSVKHRELRIFLPVFEHPRGPKYHINIRISHSGSNGQYKGDTRNHGCWDPYVYTVLYHTIIYYTIKSYTIYHIRTPYLPLGPYTLNRKPLLWASLGSEWVSFPPFVGGCVSSLRDDPGPPKRPKIMDPILPILSILR